MVERNLRLGNEMLKIKLEAVVVVLKKLLRKRLECTNDGLDQVLVSRDIKEELIS